MQSRLFYIGMLIPNVLAEIVSQSGASASIACCNTFSMR